MCGISGIVNKSGTIGSNKEIKEMNNLIAHRGPNSEGFYYGKSFNLGHRRLSILDLSKDGDQPMTHYGYTIVYNGEVYNYIELKEELASLGYAFQTKTDTEVILAAYGAWGKDCLNKFNGMWSFCIYDPFKEQLFCARDRFGIKPFYYLNTTEKFIFGSEIKQLLHFETNRYVNEEVLANYFVNQTEYDDQTFFKNVFKLPQSHYLIYMLSRNEYEICRYYELQKHDLRNTSEDDIVQNVSKLLASSILLRLRSDVRVGTCLSGGLDSSSIAALASKEYKSVELFWAIHAKSTEKYSDESKFAQEVENHCGLNLKIVTPTKSDFLNDLEKVIYNQEEPFAGTSIYMQHFVFKEAKANNCTVMLDGQGGDEILLGYERYYFSFLSSLPFFKRIKAIVNIPQNRDYR